MKHISLFILLLTISAFAFAQTNRDKNKGRIEVSKKTTGSSKQAKDTLELNEIQQRLIKAWVNRDRKTINAILADDWTVTDPAGRVLTKARVMSELDSGERRLESGTIDDVNVRLFGNVAVVTGRTAATGSYQGTSVSVKLRFMDVFVKRCGLWRAVSSQATVIAP